MKRTLRRYAAPAAVAFSLSLVLGGCGAANESEASSSDSSLSGTLSGAGASSQQAAMQAWAAGFQEQNPDVTVNYDPIGSGGGREQFIAGAVPFAGSDAFLEDEELTKAEQRCKPGQVVEVPAYISPIAVVYNLQGVDDLQLSPSTIGAIFNGDVTKWNDPAIAKDNPGVKLPSTAITPVHRSDESGTTENFTSYLEASASDSWPNGTVETWPIKGGEAAQGTSGVVSAVKQGQGTIGYADASQAGSLGVAKVKVGQEYVAYSPEAAAKVVDVSQPVQGRSKDDLAIDVARDTGASGAYPIVLVSYHIACTQYSDAAQAKLVKAFMSYVVSPQGQQAAAKSAGSAPISDDLRSKAETAINNIEAGG